MKLEEQVEKLKEKIELMKRCYYKGFSNTICGISASAYAYVSYPEERERIKPHILGMLEDIEKFYESVPFDQLDSNSDFAPLFVVRDLFPGYAENVRRLIDEPTKKLEEGISSTRTTICEVSEVYRANFKRRINELKQIPGHEDFHVILIDYKGRKYVMGKGVREWTQLNTFKNMEEKQEDFSI